MPWGKHCIVDASGCNLAAIKDIQVIKLFFDELIEKAGMTRWGDLFWMDLEESDMHEEVAGISAVQLITTSNVTIHCANKSRSIYLDFFSCKDFSQNLVYDMVKKYFSPSKVTIRTIDRDAA